jgi:pilus assembly protein Flp/PilA
MFDTRKLTIPIKGLRIFVRYLAPCQEEKGILQRPHGCAQSLQTEHHMKLVARFLKNESGATAIEYGLIAALISVAIIGGATAVGGGVNNTFTNIKGKLK